MPHNGGITVCNNLLKPDDSNHLIICSVPQYEQQLHREGKRMCTKFQTAQANANKIKNIHGKHTCRDNVVLYL